MHEMVEEYVTKKRSEQELKKQQHLIRLGLWEKEYGTWEWNETEYDENTGASYRKKALPVTDEEYAEICRYDTPPEVKNNPVAVVFDVLAWITFIGGFVFGIIAGNQLSQFQNEETFSFAAAASVWWDAFLGGMAFLGFSQIIKLLHKISQRQV